MKPFLSSIVLATTAFVLFGAEPAPPANANAAGAPVEIVPAGGGEAVRCRMLEMKDGALECLLADGETKEIKLSDVQSIRFVTPEAPKVPTAPPKEPAKTSTAATSAPTPTPGPNDSNERPRPFLPRMQPRANMKLMIEAIQEAEGNARQHKADGTLDTYINTLNERLKNAAAPEQSRECLLSLMVAYRMKEYPFEKSKELLLKEVAKMQNAQLRQTVSDNLNDWFEHMQAAIDRRRDREK